MALRTLGFGVVLHPLASAKCSLMGMYQSPAKIALALRQLRVPSKTNSVLWWLYLFPFDSIQNVVCDRKTKKPLNTWTGPFEETSMASLSAFLKPEPYRFWGVPLRHQRPSKAQKAAASNARSVSAFVRRKRVARTSSPWRKASKESELGVVGTQFGVGL